jgi:hypothetical protein
VSEYQDTLKHFEQFTYVPLAQSPQDLEVSIKELEKDIKRFAFGTDIARLNAEQKKAGDGLFFYLK